MKPVIQTLFFDKDGKGNCFEACLASIFELELNEVPWFHGESWFSQFYMWITDKGYDYLGMLSPEEILTYDKGIDGYFIVGGDSPRGKQIKGGHAVVYKKGNMIHDPHPDRTGVLKINYGLMIEPKKGNA